MKDEVKIVVEGVLIAILIAFTLIIGVEWGLK